VGYWQTKQKTDRLDAQVLPTLLLEIACPESDYGVRRIVICGNCFGTGIGWCG
jgi:hypothetical protein